MSLTSRVPAALDALRAAAVAAIGTTVTVVDGPPLDWAPLRFPGDAVSERQALFIGAAPGEDSGVEAVQDHNAAGAVSRDERAVIHCTAWSGAGDQDVKARRDEAFAIVGAVELAIAGDPTLSGAVLYAGPVQIVRTAGRQGQHGPDCVVEFDVPVRSYLS